MLGMYIYIYRNSQSKDARHWLCAGCADLGVGQHGEQPHPWEGSAWSEMWHTSGTAFVHPWKSSGLAAKPCQEKKKASEDVQTALSRPPVVEYWKGSDQAGLSWRGSFRYIPPWLEACCCKLLDLMMFPIDANAKRPNPNKLFGRSITTLKLYSSPWQAYKIVKDSEALCLSSLIPALQGKQPSDKKRIRWCSTCTRAVMRRSSERDVKLLQSSRVPFWYPDLMSHETSLIWTSTPMR